MKLGCKIIEDILPLYADKICSEESRQAVEEHCKECAGCRNKLEAMNIELPEKKTDSKPENPMKKVRRHYVKLAVTTLLIGMLAFPLCGVIILNINEEGNISPSWSTISADNTVKKFAKGFMNGDYSVLEKNAIMGEDGEIYTVSNSGTLFADYTFIFERFFKKYPIVSYDYEASYRGMRYEGSLFLDLDSDSTGGYRYCMMIDFLMQDGRMCITEALVTMKDFSSADIYSDDRIRISKQLSKDFTYLSYPGNSAAMLLQSALASEKYENIKYILITQEYAELVDKIFEETDTYSRLKTVERETYTGIDDAVANREAYEEKFDSDVKKLFGDYTFVTAYYTLPSYTDTPTFEGTDGNLMYGDNHCYIQEVHLYFKTKDGTEFDVWFTAKLNSRYECPLRDVYYSDETPREFKIAFEELFM